MKTMPCRVFLLRAECLQQARQRVLAGDVRLQPALSALRHAAEAALSLAPSSVIEKQCIPPSGDRHDYMSLAPYWWPDPTTADGLPYIRRDGEVNPESREDSDRQRMETLLDTVETLAFAAFFTGEPRYGEQAAVLLRHWFLTPATRMNPHLRYGQAIPGITEGRDIGIIDTRKLAMLVDALGLLHAMSTLTAEDEEGMRGWLQAYLDWLLASEHGQGEAAQHNNHGTWYDVQVATLACYLGREDVARRVLAESACRRFDTQLAADGRQPHELARTRSWNYSVMNLEGLICLAELGSHVGIDLWHHVTPSGSSLRAAIDFLAPYADLTLTWPYLQIIPSNRLDRLPYLLRQAALVLNAPVYDAQLAQLPAESLAAHRVQLLYPMGE